MLLLWIVLGFPLILTAGYGLAFVLSGRNVRLLGGAVGFLLYIALLTIPLIAVLLARPNLPGSALAWLPATPWWLVAGAAAGLALWGVQLAAPGRTPDASATVWVGPPGPGGFALVMLPVCYVVFAEELVWRGFLVPEVGMPLSAAAFALHHYHFGLRHIVFTIGAGLVWGALFLLADTLWPAVVSHLTYNALAWRWMRRKVPPA
jgi:membrane protease YdiL (CAAX protease family)